MKRIFLIAILMCLSIPAFAQGQCNTHDKVGAALGAAKYQEFVVAAGVSATGHLVEIYNNEKTGGFSIILTTPDKMSCLAIAGEEFFIKSEEQRKLEAMERLPKY